MRGRKEYPKMIYKGGKVDVSCKSKYCVVSCYAEHMEKLEEWGDKRPDDLVKPVKREDDNLNAENAPEDQSKPVADKPKRGRKPKAK